MTLARAISVIGSMQAIRESTDRIQAWEVILSEILSHPAVTHQVAAESTTVT
jgi:hypothetical protein